MHLDTARSKRFYRLFNALTLETDQALGVAEHPLDLPGATPGDQLAVLQRIADEPELISDFISNTPLALTADDKSILEQWMNLLSGKFLLSGFSDNGNALLESEMGTVEICGITQEISEIVSAPSFVKTVVMPFDDVLTFGAAIATYPVAIGPNMAKTLKDEQDGVEGKAILRTPEQFIPALGKWREEKLERDWLELQKQMRRDYDKAHGIEEMPKGFHRSIIADLCEEYQDEDPGEGADDIIKVFLATAETTLREQAIRGPVRRKLATALADLSKDELRSIADHLLVDAAFWTMTKRELIETIGDAISNGPESPASLENQLTLVSDDIHEEFWTIFENGGKIEAEKPNESMIGWEAAPPLVFLYQREFGDPFTFAIMSEVMDKASDIDRKTLDAARFLVSEVDNAARVCATFYGIIAAEDFASEFNRLMDADMPADFIIEQLLQLVAYGYPDYDICIDDGVIYLCDELLTPNGNGVEPESAEADAIRAFRQHVLERHRTTGRVPLERIINLESCMDYALELDSAHLLRDWLNAHVPDGADDYRYADGLLFDIFDSTRGPIDPNYVPQLLIDAGALPEDIDIANDLLALTMRFVNNIPLWENGGYSPTELAERETGRRIFFNEDGRPKKIGRNDPCPCGSGKKYKKCCGR